MSSLRRQDGSASRSPLKVKSTDLYNIVHGQVAPTKVNIQNAFHFGITQSEKFASWLPGAFHITIERSLAIRRADTHLFQVLLECTLPCLIWPAPLSSAVSCHPVLSFRQISYDRRPTSLDWRAVSSGCDLLQPVRTVMSLIVTTV